MCFLVVLERLLELVSRWWWLVRVIPYSTLSSFHSELPCEITRGYNVIQRCRGFVQKQAPQNVVIIYRNKQHNPKLICSVLYEKLSPTHQGYLNRQGKGSKREKKKERKIAMGVGQNVIASCPQTAL